MGALSHIRVLDLSRILAGPWCSQILADLGADVIKIERPGHGDDTRGWGPPWLIGDDGRPTAEAAYYLAANRGKRSVAVDLAQPAGQALVRDLARDSDIVLENYKTGTLARYGLDYASLRPLNPGLIYCSITGFGQTGPRAGQPGYDFIVQGMGGLMSVTGERDDRPGGGPQKAGIAVSDIMTGLYAAVAIQAALIHRASSGEGQYIDMALLDVQVAAMANLSMNYLVSGRVPGRHGNAHANIVPYEVFQAADRPFIIACGNDTQFAALCGALGQAPLARDPRFTRNAGRVTHRETLIPLLAELFRKRNAADWIARIEPLGIPIGPINTLAEVFAEPQVEARGMTVTLPHPDCQQLPLVASPMKLSATPVEHRRAPPLLGEHTAEVLRERLGIDAARYAELLAGGIVAGPADRDVHDPAPGRV